MDDIRLYIFPLNKGWSWTEGGWRYTPNCTDTRTDVDRTRDELNKSFDTVIDCLLFTTESQRDFDSNSLPTLDVQTMTGEDGIIQYKHFEGFCHW